MSTLSRIRNLSFALLALGAFLGAGSIASSTDAEARGFRAGGGFRVGIHVGVVRHGFHRPGYFRPGFARPAFWHGHHGWRRPIIVRPAIVAVRAPVVVTPSCYVVRRVNAYGYLVRVPVCS